DQSFAVGLQAAELLHGGFDAALDALLVQREIAERLRAMEDDAGGDQEGLFRFGTGRKGGFGRVGVPGVGGGGVAGGVARVDEFRGQGEHGLLDGTDAAQTPVSFGDVAGDLEFEVSGGAEVVDESGDELFVVFALLPGQERATGGDAVGGGVGAGALLAFDGDWAGGLFGIGAVGGKLGVGKRFLIGHGCDLSEYRSKDGVEKSLDAARRSAYATTSN